jgi:hypothetical protein
VIISHNMQVSIMLNAILVGIYPPTEIRIEASRLGDIGCIRILHGTTH